MRKALFHPVIALIALTVLVGTAGCGTSASQASPVRFGGPKTGAALHATPPGKRSLVQWPTHPISFEEVSRVGGPGRTLR